MIISSSPSLVLKTAVIFTIAKNRSSRQVWRTILCQTRSLGIIDSVRGIAVFFVLHKHYRGISWIIMEQPDIIFIEYAKESDEKLFTFKIVFFLHPFVYAVFY